MSILSTTYLTHQFIMYPVSDQIKIIDNQKFVFKPKITFINFFRNLPLFLILECSTNYWMFFLLVKYDQCFDLSLWQHQTLFKGLLQSEEGKVDIALQHCNGLIAKLLQKCDLPSQSLPSDHTVLVANFINSSFDDGLKITVEECCRWLLAWDTGLSLGHQKWIPDLTHLLV